jgi:dTDP-4-dehydrorhamnose 3,5-epimerase
VQIDPVAVPDAWLCTPRQFPDDRGVFLEWFRGDRLAERANRRIDVLQANHSISRRGTLRGLHFADVPPGQAKYVYCARGAILDVVVDIRDGSPTFGQHAAVQLDDETRRGFFIAEGLAHGFCALTETAEVTYLVSTTYNPTAEHTVNALDPALDIPWPKDVGALVLSDKDSAAPSVEQARATGTLPSYDACRARYSALSRP